MWRNTGSDRRASFLGMFRKVLKKSPRDYVEEYRIRQACQLLGETNLPVTTIAHSVGYEDPLYFSKAFKKNTGRAPSDYRKIKAAGGTGEKMNKKGEKNVQL